MDELDTTNEIGQIPVFSPTEFVAVANQSLEYIFPSVVIIGEMSSFKISKGKWVYFDIKDDSSKIKCFGLVFQIKTIIEEGMQIEVVAQPRLHNLYGFSLNIKSVRPVGEGSIKKAADLLKIKLEKEGLFSQERKRPLPTYPARVGLIASEQSAAYGDFIKILNARWSGVEIILYDAQVQGDAAAESIVSGIQYFSQTTEAPEIIVITRGGGSIDDLSVFSTEPVVRAVAASRIPTVVAIGHELDISLAELAADLRASTPSNAAELLFPDKNELLSRLKLTLKGLGDNVNLELERRHSDINEAKLSLLHSSQKALEQKAQSLKYAKNLLDSFHPRSTLKRGYAIVQSKGRLVTSTKQISTGSIVDLTLQDGEVRTKVQ